MPPDLLNGGRFTLGVNASSYRVRRYFMDEKALEFNVNTSGAPGMQWAEPRPGVLRPRLEWTIEAEVKAKSIGKNVPRLVSFYCRLGLGDKSQGRETCQSVPSGVAQISNAALNGRDGSF